MMHSIFTSRSRIIALSAILASTTLVGSAGAQGWSGNIEGGFFGTDRTSTDTDIEGSPFSGLYLGGQAQMNYGSTMVSIDGRYEVIDDQGLNYTYESGPVHGGVLGLHVGQEFGAAFVGVFAAAGYFDAYEQDGPESGTILGLEASYALPSNTKLYAQIGAVEAIGDPNDNEYVGYAGRLGAMHDYSEAISVGASFEFGQSDDCFVDCGDQPGEFTSFTLDGAYAVSSNIDAVGSIMYMDVYDEDDDDTGTDLSVFIGLRMNLGGTASNSALTTPMGAFRAAGWMEPLD